MATLPVFIPLSEAARKYGLDEDYLRQMVERGKIRAGVVAGEMVVSEEEVREEEVRKAVVTRKEDLPEYQKYEYLKGVEIGFSEAVNRYGINLSTLQRWFKKGLIAELKRERKVGGEKILLDEADVAYCVEVYKNRGGRGRWLFDKKGMPYQPKNKSLSI